jgi:hypothetical protein
MRQNRRIDSAISNTIFDFGLAHVISGGLNLVEHLQFF